MKDWQKLLRKISGKERQSIDKALEKIEREEQVRSIKLKISGQRRIRVGNYRIIIHLENGRPVLDDLRRRNEGTYK